MKVVSLIFACWLAAPVAAVSLLERDVAVSLKERPIMKIVRLLQDTQAELEKELEDDKAVHELLACWCKTNEQEKTAAIEAGNAKIAQLDSSMANSLAKVAELKEKRAETMAEIKKDTEALGEATELRFKENKEFHGSETDLIEAIDASKNAIIVLGKHNPALPQLKAMARRLLDARVSQLVSNSRMLGSANAEILQMFLKKAEKATSFLAIPGMQSYAPQSGQIFGILKQMKEDFESTLSSEQKAEAKAQAEYDALKAAKEDEIATGQKLVVSTDASIAEFQEKHAQASKELKDTQEQLGLDTEFLASLTEKCSVTDAEFDKRVKDRLTEIDAVSDTIKILNSDDSFEAFDKALLQQDAAPASFLQTSSQNLRRQRAMSALKRAAAVAPAGSAVAALALLQQRAQLDAFTKVKQLIDDMVAQLKVQQQEEVEHRDWCTSEFNKNERLTAAAYDKKESLTVKIEDLKKTIETLTKDIDASKAAVEEMMTQMKKASETREAENGDFQTTVSDHRVMAVILQKAIDRMKQVYAMLEMGKPGAAHTQTSATDTDPGNGPAKFKEYSKNAGGGRVVTMLEEVMTDVKKTEVEAMRSEMDSQAAYENFMKDSNKSLLKTQKAIANMQGAKATSKVSLTMAETDFKSTMTELEGLDSTKADLHGSCDFVVKNFDARQKARADEIDALGEAKAILSGAA